MRGPLRKKGAWSSSWKTSWFVCSGGMLMEYSKPKAKRPRNVIKLDACRVKLASRVATPGKYSTDAETWSVQGRAHQWRRRREIARQAALPPLLHT